LPKPRQGRQVFFGNTGSRRAKSACIEEFLSPLPGLGETENASSPGAYAAGLIPMLFS